MIELWPIPELVRVALDEFLGSVECRLNKPRPQLKDVLSLDRWLEIKEDRPEPPGDEQYRGILIGSIHGVFSAVKKFFPTVTSSGVGYYPPGGHYGWHTNSNNPGKRLYLVHVLDGGKSFFRWIENGEAKTSYDEQGWNARLFPVPCWHCVYSDTERISIGFRM